MRKLSEPYDKEEHEELMKLITEQKRQGRHLDLRSGRVIFSTSNKMGKSLLDRHWGNLIFPFFSLHVFSCSRPANNIYKLNIFVIVRNSYFTDLLHEDLYKWRKSLSILLTLKMFI